MNVYVARVSQQLAERGIAVDVFTRWHEPGAAEVVQLAPNLRVVHLEAGGQAPRPKEEVPPLLREFLQHFVQFKERNGVEYDLLHSHYWLSGWVAARLSRRWRVPHVTMFHTLGAVKNQARVGEHETPLRVRTEGRVVRQADAVVVASQEEHHRLLQHYPAARGKVRTIPCGVDLDLFQPLSQAEARAHLGLNGERILLFVGRPDPLKGLEILLSAANLLEDPEGVRVLVIGGEATVPAPLPPDGAAVPSPAGILAPGPGGEFLDGGRTLPVTLQETPWVSPAGDQEAHPRDVAKVASPPEVSFLGRVSHQMLPYYYSAADVCVIPSYYESFGMVALEAMACGVPVVAARVGGLQSTVRDGETGYLIPWHCPEPFAERLELLLGNETLRSRLGKASRIVAESYRWSGVADQLMELYDEVGK